jgi:hypothetical protein
MKLTQPYKQHVAKLVKYLREEMYLHEWDLTLKFAEHPKEEKDDCVADIHTDSKYLNATITFYPRNQAAFNRNDGKYILDTVVHELCHILTEPLYIIAINGITNTASEFLEEVRERQTQRITNIIIPFIPKSVYTIKTKSHVPTKKPKTHKRSTSPRKHRPRNRR